MEAFLLLFAGAASALGAHTAPIGVSSGMAYSVIVLTAVAMGVRNAIVRRLAVPDLTTTVLTLTVTGLAADSSLAGGTNPRWKTRVAAIAIMFTGAASGALLLRLGLTAPLAASSLLAFLVLAFLALPKHRKQ
jgi:uncharacterized membrane protein YoaK (UPF0700 family)